jgi:predicted MFS family arabinose efflux permease
MSAETQHPHAKKALVLLTAVNYLNYIDRYILAAVLVSIKADLALSDFQAGLLATAFMLPYMFTAPLFGWLGDTRDRSRILSLGAGLWSLATFITGFSKNFVSIMSSRFFLGIGESAFTTVSVPFLSHYFPREKQGRVIAILSSGLPVGAALGFVLGGVLGSTVGWRNAFYIVGFPGLFLSVMIWLLGEPRKTVEKTQFDYKKTLKVFLASKPYVLTVLGYCAYSFVVGGIAHWVPTYVQREYALNELNANTLFGGIAVGSGLIGTLSGGWIGDWLERKNQGGHLLVCSISMLLALPAFWFCMHTSSVKEFAICLALAQICFFLSTSPVNLAVLRIIPRELENSGMAFLIFMAHILGDSISAPLIGKISDMTGSLKAGILVCTPVILLSSIFWGLGRRTLTRPAATKES